MPETREAARQAGPEKVVGYTLRDNRYLNITNRCSLRCAFCPKFNDEWTVRDYPLRLDHEPMIEEIAPWPPATAANTALRPDVFR
jgi:TatD DNase family protein